MIRLIDYSTAALGLTLPPCRGGKFVLIRDEETEYLVLSPAILSKHHATILERFAAENEIEGMYLKRPFHYVFREPGWDVFGGGEWMIDEKRMVLHLFGKSVTYGKFHAEELIRNIQKIPKMGKYKIIIDGR